MNQFLNFYDIKILYPDEWVLLGNPVSKNGKIVSGIVILHSHDKKEVCYLGKDKIQNFDRVAVTYTGDIKSQRRIGILVRL